MSNLVQEINNIYFNGETLDKHNKTFGFGSNIETATEVIQTIDNGDQPSKEDLEKLVSKGGSIVGCAGIPGLAGSACRKARENDSRQGKASNIIEQFDI